MIKIIFLISCLLLTLHLDGQDNKTYSEAEIKTQTSFLDARITLFKEDTVSAIKMFKEIYNNSSMSMAAWELSKIYKLQKDFFNAEKYCRRVGTDINTQEYFLLYQLSLYSLSGNDVYYQSTLEQLIKNFPENDGYFYKLIDDISRNKNYSKALKMLNKEQKEKGIIEEIIKRKYSIYMSQGKHKKAEKSLISLIEEYPEEILYLYNIASFYSQTKEMSKLKKVYNQILKLNPDDENAKMVLNMKESQNNEVNGLRALIPLAENPESNIDELIKRLIPYVENINEENDPEISKTLLILCEKLAIAHPNDAKSNSIYADVLYSMGELEKSKQQYIKTLAINKSVFSVWNQIFLIDNRLKNYSSLTKYTEEGLDYYPNQATTYIYNSIGLAMKGQPENALDILEDAKFMINSSDNYTKQLFEIAQISILIKMDKIDDAKKRMDVFVTNKEKLSFEILENISELFHILGDSNTSDSLKKLSIEKGNQYLKNKNNVEK